MLEFFGSFHPVAVHFPLALTLAGGLAELIHMKTKNEAFAFSARFMLYTAAACAVVSSVLGLAESSGEHVSADLQFAFGAHRVAGLVSTGLIVLAAGLAESARRENEPWRYTLYRLMLLVCIIAVWTAGYFGATLVHGLDHFSFP